MRWLVIGLLVSVATLLLLAGGVARYVRHQKRLLAEESVDLDARKARHLELDKALDFPEDAESKKDAVEQ